MQFAFSGPWGTCASFCFFMGALFGGDLLALRAALMCAYIFGFINGLTGLPQWPFVHVPWRLGVEAMAWALLTGSLHACAVIRMVRDELPVRFDSDDDEQVATFFYRRSGMERLEAKEALKRGRWVRVQAGQCIVSSAQLHENLYLMVEGSASFSNGSPGLSIPARRTASSRPWSANSTTLYDQSEAERDAGPLVLARTVFLTGPLPGEEQPPPPPLPPPPQLQQQSWWHAGYSSALMEPLLSVRSLGSKVAAPRESFKARPGVARAQAHQQQQQLPLKRSGHLFSLSLLNVFGVFIGFEQTHHRQLEVWAETDCLLYAWSLPALEEMATRCSPSLAAYWRNMTMFSLADEFEQRMHRGTSPPRCSTGEFEPSAWLQGARSRDFTDPPRGYEATPRFSAARVARWLRRAVNPLQPPGLRHSALPLTGVMARTRAVAMAEAARLSAESSRNVDHC